VRRRRLRFLARWDTALPRFLTWRTLTLLAAPRGGVVMTGEVGTWHTIQFVTSHA
jgi:hypothetical protein